MNGSGPAGGNSTRQLGGPEASLSGNGIGRLHRVVSLLHISRDAVPTGTISRSRWLCPVVTETSIAMRIRKLFEQMVETI